MPPKRIVTSRTASKGDWAAVPGMAKTASYSTPCRFFSGERIACHTDFRGTGSAYSDSGARGDPIMHPVVGIFTRREDAERAAGELEPAGIDRGRISVVIVLPDDDQRAEVARAVLSANGAESLDAFRERWWKGLRDVEAAHYESTGQPFAAAEPDYRRGFECALGAGQRDRAYDDVVNKLKQRYPDVYNTEAFRRGYERGQARAAGRRSDRAA